MNKVKIKFYLEKLLENYFPDNLNTSLNYDMKSAVGTAL